MNVEFIYCEIIPFWKSYCAAAIRKILITNGKPARRVQCCRVVSRSVRYHFRRQLSLLSLILRALFRFHKQKIFFNFHCGVFFWQVCVLFAIITFSIINFSVFRIRRLFVSARVIFSVVNCLRCAYYLPQHANCYILFFAISAYYFTRRIFRHYYSIFRRICRCLRVRMLSCFRWAFYFFVTIRPVIYINYSANMRVLFTVTIFSRLP